MLVTFSMPAEICEIVKEHVAKCDAGRRLKAELELCIIYAVVRAAVDAGRFVSVHDGEGWATRLLPARTI